MFTHTQFAFFQKSSLSNVKSCRKYDPFGYQKRPKTVTSEQRIKRKLPQTTQSCQQVACIATSCYHYKSRKILISVFHQRFEPKKHKIGQKSRQVVRISASWICECTILTSIKDISPRESIIWRGEDFSETDGYGARLCGQHSPRFAQKLQRRSRVNNFEHFRTSESPKRIE